MPITLNIDFVGLCLWANDPKPPKPKGATDVPKPLVHVLLLAPDLDPDAVATNGGHDHGATHRHHPRLFYDTAYDADAPAKLTRKFSSISLEDKALDLSAFGGVLDTTLPDIPDISRLESSTIPRFRVGPNPLDLITARITLASGKATPVNPAKPWDLDTDKGIAIAHKVTWTLTVDTTQLDWALLGLNGRGGQPLTRLRPVGNIINLRIVNVPRADLSATDKPFDAPKPGHQMAHFTPFYGVLKNAKKRFAPIWRGKQTSNGNPVGGNFNCGQGKGTVG